MTEAGATFQFRTGVVLTLASIVALIVVVNMGDLENHWVLALRAGVAMVAWLCLLVGGSWVARRWITAEPPRRAQVVETLPPPVQVQEVVPQVVEQEVRPVQTILVVLAVSVLLTGTALVVLRRKR